jgi:hypothetical protein
MERETESWIVTILSVIVQTLIFHYLFLFEWNLSFVFAEIISLLGKISDSIRHYGSKIHK